MAISQLDIVAKRCLTAGTSDNYKDHKMAVISDS